MNLIKCKYCKKWVDKEEGMRGYCFGCGSSTNAKSRGLNRNKTKRLDKRIAELESQIQKMHDNGLGESWVEQFNAKVAEKDKRIAELKEQINNYILRSVNNQKILNDEGKDGGGDDL